MCNLNEIADVYEGGWPMVWAVEREFRLRMHAYERARLGQVGVVLQDIQIAMANLRAAFVGTSFALNRLLVGDDLQAECFAARTEVRERVSAVREELGLAV